MKTGYINSYILISFPGLMMSKAFRKLVIIGSCFLIFSSVSYAQTEYCFQMKINPTDYIFSPHMRGFEVSIMDEFGNNPEDHPLGSEVIYYPQIGFGLGINHKRNFYDITLGIGFTVADPDIMSGPQLSGPLFSTDLAYRFRITNGFSAGVNFCPLIGNIKIKYDRFSYDVKTRTFIGFCAGPTLTLGKKASFYFALNYLYGHVRIEEISSSYSFPLYFDYPDHLDISGIYLRLGLALRSSHPDVYVKY